MCRLPALIAAAALAALIAGCGGEAGVSSGATVSVYVSDGLCAAAKRELAREDGRAGSLRVRAVCLARERDRGRLDLAAVGANARRATEDSTAVAYVEAPDPDSGRFSHPILESAGIAWIRASSGATATARILGAVTQADTASLRESVGDALEPASR